MIVKIVLIVVTMIIILATHLVQQVIKTMIIHLVRLKHNRANNRIIHLGFMIEEKIQNNQIIKIIKGILMMITIRLVTLDSLISFNYE